MVRMRLTRSKVGMRRSHHGLSPKKIIKSGDSDAVRLPHRACPHTGMYRGRKVFEPKIKKVVKNKSVQNEEENKNVMELDTPSDKA